MASRPPPSEPHWTVFAGIRIGAFAGGLLGGAIVWMLGSLYWLVLVGGVVGAVVGYRVVRAHG